MLVELKLNDKNGLDNEKELIKYINRADEILQELSKILTNLSWYNLRPELVNETLTAEYKDSAVSEK